MQRELVISTAPAPERFPLAETFVLCAMVLGLGVLIGLIVAFALSGRRKGNPRAVVNMAGVASGRRGAPVPARLPAVPPAPPAKLKCACRRFPEACEICCPLEGPPSGMPPDRRQ